MPAKSKAQRGYAAMSSTRKGRAKLRAEGKKPMPMDVAKEYRRGPVKGGKSKGKR